MTIGQLIIRTWTPSRFAKWKECPSKVKYEDLMKMCPRCFKGRVSGGYDGEPVVCDTCDQAQPEREAMDRGNRLDAALTLHVSRPTVGPPAKGKEDLADHEAHLAEAVRHPVVERLAKTLRKKPTGQQQVFTQESIVLNDKWQRVSQYTKNAWARVKLDVLVLKTKIAEVLDWKSGNIDKSKGEIREKPEYHDSMRAYQLVVLAVYPKIQEVKARMVFLDAPPKLAEPFKDMAVLRRRDLEATKRAWEAKMQPMLNDTIFAPRPGYYCTWCPFSKDKGGPCSHSGQRR